MERLSKYVSGICMVILLLSCRTQKPVSVVDESAGVIKKSASPEAIFTTGHPFNTMKVKRMNIDFSVNGLNDNFNGNMAIRRDSLIVISVIPLLGYEAVRIMCTKDSIIIINRTDKTFHASSLVYYLKKNSIPAEYKDLQAVLTNEAFYYRNNRPGIRYEKEIKLEEESILLVTASLSGSVKLTNQEIIADSSCQKIRSIFVVDYNRNTKMLIQYDDFNGCESGSFPNKISINVKDRIRDISLDLEYGQVLFNERINVKFEVPEGYSRIHM
jgi:hypothetical protein